MRGKHFSADEQYKLIIECRQSGKTDYQWCTEHGINPGTFYNWVSRLKKKACCDIPESLAKDLSSKASNSQDVVKVDILPDFTREPVDIPNQYQPVSFVPVAEINVNGICVRLSNDAGAALIRSIIGFVGGTI